MEAKAATQNQSEENFKNSRGGDVACGKNKNQNRQKQQNKSAGQKRAHEPNTNTAETIRQL